MSLSLKFICIHILVTLAAAEFVVEEQNIRVDVKFRYVNTTVETKLWNSGTEDQEQVIRFSVPELAFITDLNITMVDRGWDYKSEVTTKADLSAVINEDMANCSSCVSPVPTTPQRFVRDYQMVMRIPAGHRITIFLVYEQLLVRKMGIYEISIPVEPPRFVINGAQETQVPIDRLYVRVRIHERSDIIGFSRESVKFLNKFAEDIDAADVLNSMFIPIFRGTSGDLKTAGFGTELISFTTPGKFVVTYDVERIENGGEVLLDECGHFIHYFAPTGLPYIKKNIYFVLDHSGSMWGLRIQQLQEAMVTIFGDMVERDNFNLIVFSYGFAVWDPVHGERSSVDMWKFIDGAWKKIEANLPDLMTPIAATTENLAAAKDYIKSLWPSGSTNIYDSMSRAIHDIKNFDAESDRRANIILFLTDGHANAGEYTRTVDIIRELTKENTDENNVNERHAIIHGLGFGQDLDFDLLRGLTLNNNGFSRRIYEALDAGSQLVNFYNEFSSLVLQDVNFTYTDTSSESRIVGSESASSLYFPTHYDGSELAVSGESHPDETLSATVSGSGADSDVNFRANSTTLTDQSCLFERYWAFKALTQAIEQCDSLDTAISTAAYQKAEELSLKYGFTIKTINRVVPDYPQPGCHAILLDAEDVLALQTTSLPVDSDTQCFVYADPHIVVRMGGLDHPVCFDLNGNKDDTWVLYETGTASRKPGVNHGRITGQLITDLSGTLTYFGTINFQMKKGQFWMKVDASAVEVRYKMAAQNKGRMADQPKKMAGQFMTGQALRWTEFMGRGISFGPDVAVKMVRDDCIVIEVNASDSDMTKFVVMKHRHPQINGTDLHYVSMYMVHPGSLFHQPVGIIGQLSVENVRHFEELTEDTGKLQLAGRSVPVRKSSRIDQLHSDRVVHCWSVHNLHVNAALFGGHIQRFLLKTPVL